MIQYSKARLSTNRRFRMIAAASTLALAAFAPASAAHAQDAAQETPDSAAPPAQGAASGEQAEVVVTGSRLARRGGDAPTPLTVVGQEQLQLLGDTNVGDALNRLPALRAQSGPTVVGFTQANAGSQILDLRGLGAQRTLVLVDGRRFVPSTTQGTFDLNLIPSNIIQRAEIVTGGASAAYGSDAVAGVVNIILDTRFNGIRASASFGISGAGDNQDYTANIAAGSDIFGGRGHIVIAAEYAKNDGMGDCYTRRWCSPDGDSDWFSTTNPGGPGANGLPFNILGYVHNANLTQAGLINNTALRGTQFNANGTTSSEPFIFGIGASPTASFMIGGSGRMFNHDNLLLKPPVERFTLFTHLDYDLTDSIRLFAEASFGRTNAMAYGAQPFDTGLVIRRDNAFLPADIAARMDQLGITQFNLGKRTTEAGLSVTRARRETFRLATGLRGDLGADWHWDAYYQYGETSSVQSSTNNRINANFTRAIDSTRNGAGQAVCRSSLGDPTNGCSPFNPFGIGQASAASIAYAFGTSQSNFRYTQHVVAANVRGSPFSTWAGEVQTAVGAEYRADTALGTADPIGSVSGFLTNNAAPIDGRINVLEGYAEASVPLARDFVLANLLEINGAVRQTHYSRDNSRNPSSTVNATTWKVGAIWEPVRFIRFRATQSRDIRAPNMVELFSLPASTQTFISENTIVNGTPVNFNGNVTTFTGGNSALTPERADTTTLGVVLRPDREWLGGTVTLSVDYFNVNLKGAIATLGGQTVVNRCNAGITDYCQFVTRDPVTRLLTRIDNVNLNLNRLIARGIDIELNASFPVNLFSRSGTLGFRGLATHNIQLTTVDSFGVRTNRAGMNGFPTGQTSGIPDWVFDATLSYATGPLTVAVQTHSLTGGKYNVDLIGPEDPGYSITLPNSVNTNRVAGRTYVHLSVNYDLSEHFTVFGVVTNIFNATPPPNPTAIGSYNPVLYDIVGRDFRIGVRANF
jgi:outer membrane receptor protein involved in Fe transport